MKIRYRLLYALPLVSILILDMLFSTLLTGPIQMDEFGASDPSPLANYPSLIIAGCVPASFLLYKHLDGIARYVFWFALIGIGLLMAESYLRYAVPAVYPHVFQKVMVLFTLTAMYGVYKIIGRITLADLIGMIWVALLINVTVIYPSAVSMSAFVNHQRGLVASSVYLLTLPLLYHFNTYLQTRKPLQLGFFFLAGLTILFFQHRTVWVVSVASLLLNLFLIVRVARQRLNFKTLLPMLSIPAVVLFLGVTSIAVSNPKVLIKIADNIADIENHDKQGTGSWRAEQARSYWPFIEANPVAGMRFQGFELPIQFYDPEQPTMVVFEDGHGHFLHSFYIDSLFYLGTLGLLLLCMPQLYTLLRMIRRPPIHPEALTWSIFIATSLVYGYSYSLPPYFYGLAGFGLLRINQLADTVSDPSPETSIAVVKQEHSAEPVTYSA